MTDGTNFLKKIEAAGKAWREAEEGLAQIEYVLSEAERHKKQTGVPTIHLNAGSHYRNLKVDLEALAGPRWLPRLHAMVEEAKNVVKAARLDYITVIHEMAPEESAIAQEAVAQKRRIRLEDDE